MIRTILSWLFRLTILAGAIIVLVGFAHYSGLRKTSVYHNASKPSSFQLTVQQTQPLTKLNQEHTACMLTSTKINSHYTVTTNSHTKPTPGIYTINLTHIQPTKGKIHFTGAVSLPLFNNKTDTPITLYGIALDKDITLGSGVLKTSQCQGLFTIKKIKNNAASLLQNGKAAALKS